MERVLVVDTNLGLEHALGIARDGYEVYYAVVHGQPYPRMQDEYCGYGFSEINKIWDWGEGLEKGAKVVIFTDSGFGHLADWLREKGFYVFGSDAITEKLELDRVFVRNVFKELGISVPKGRVIKGVKNVIQYIKEHKKKVYVKINRVRGDVETFGTDDYVEADIILSRGAFRILGENAVFVVEDELKGVEIGIDTWFNGKNFIPIVAETIEISGTGNATSFKHINESIWRDILEKLEPWLRYNGYVGMFCLEGFFDGNDIYVTDVTPRFPYICSYAYPKVIVNYGDFIIDVAKGKTPIPRVLNKYSVQIGVYTDDKETWRLIEYKGNDKDWIAYRRVIKKGNKLWFVPGDCVVAVAISSSDDLYEACLAAAERADNVSCDSSYTEAYGFINKLFDIVEQAERLGYVF